MVEQFDGQASWWTFAGLAANVWLAVLVGDLRDRTSQTHGLEIRLAPGESADGIREHVEVGEVGEVRLADAVVDGAVEQLEFHEGLPDELPRPLVTERLDARSAAGKALSRRVRGHRVADRP